MWCGHPTSDEKTWTVLLVFCVLHSCTESQQAEDLDLNRCRCLRPSIDAHISRILSCRIVRTKSIIVLILWQRNMVENTNFRSSISIYRPKNILLSLNSLALRNMNTKDLYTNDLCHRHGLPYRAFGFRPVSSESPISSEFDLCFLIFSNFLLSPSCTASRYAT